MAGIWVFLSKCVCEDLIEASQTKTMFIYQIQPGNRENKTNILVGCS